jgi:hypothetical protein
MDLDGGPGCGGEDEMCVSHALLLLTTRPDALGGPAKARERDRIDGMLFIVRSKKVGGEKKRRNNKATDVCIVCGVCSTMTLLSHINQS